MIPVITISREVGSNGHKIGEMLAEELKLPLLDKTFVTEVAEKTGFTKDNIEKRSEYFSQFDMYMNSRSYLGMYIGDDQSDMFYVQKKIILEQAKKGPCVIVGRCADAILREEGIPALNVFVHADMAYRIEQYRERFPEIGDDIEKLMHKKDKGRRAYYRFYTDDEWGAVDSYDLTLNSSKLGLEACVAIIKTAAEAMK